MKKVALLLLLALPLFAAEPTYVIRYRLFAAVGKSTHVRSQFSMNDSMTFVDPSGTETTKPLSQEKNEDYIEKVLAVDKDEATEFIRTYTTPADKSYTGRPVHFVRSAGVVKATADGAELKELDELAKDEKSGTKEARILLPKQPVTVGQTWPIDALSATESLGPVFGKFDAKRSHGEGKLVSVTKQNGHTIATIEATMDLVSVPGTAKDFSSLSQFHAAIRMEGAIDGSAHLRSTIAATIKAEQPVTTNGGKVVVKHDFNFTKTAEQDDLP